MAWSQFFGSVRGSSQTDATRCGNKDSGLSMVAASKTGAITVKLSHWGGRHCFEIVLTSWGSSRFEDILLARGSFPVGDGNPIFLMPDETVRAYISNHVEREALKVMTKEAR